MMDQQGRFEVSVGGLLLLAGAAIATTGLVFLLGVYVGKGIAEKRYLGRQEAVRIPVEPLGEESGESRQTFWDRLDDRPEPPAEERVEAESAPTPEPRIRIGAPRAPSTPPGEPTPEPTPAPVRETRIEEEVPAVEPPETAAVRYQVQITALADREAAFGLVRRLRRDGHDARVVEGTADGRQLYRVRVGSYANREAADRAAASLKQEGYTDSYPVPE